MMLFNDGDWRSLSQLLTPSWLSGLLALSAGLIVTVGVIIAFTANNGTVQQQLVAWQAYQPQRALTTPDQVLTSNDKPTLKGSWPLVLVWSLVGLVVYGIAASIVRSLGQAAALRESLEYVHAKPKALLKDAAEHVALRVLAFIMLTILLVLFFNRVIPYSITASHAAAADIISPDGLLYASLSFAIVAVSLHLQVIFLRLSFGRVRIFSQV